jgi:hypothetical protein
MLQTPVMTEEERQLVAQAAAVSLAPQVGLCWVGDLLPRGWG